MNPQQIALLAALILAIWQVVTIIVRLTPTKKDDEIVSSLGKLFNLLIIGNRVKGATADAAKQETMARALTDLMHIMQANNQGAMFKKAVDDAANKTVDNVNLPESVLNKKPLAVEYVIKSSLAKSVGDRTLYTGKAEKLKKEIAS